MHPQADTPLARRMMNARTLGSPPAVLPAVPHPAVGELLRHQAGCHPDKHWITFYPEGAESRVTATYREFLAAVNQTANFLLSSGISRGDRIATIAHNHIDTVIQYFAAWTIGAVVVPINVGEDDKRIAFILENSNVRLAFVRQEYLHRAGQIIASHPSLQKMTLIATDDYLRGRSGQPATLRETANAWPEDEALIVYTSGTTGLPKGVVLTHNNLLVDAASIAEWHSVTPDQKMMCVLPIHHVNGTVVTLLTPLTAGAGVILCQKFHSGTFFERIAAEQIHVVSVVPSLLQFLLHEYSTGQPAPCPTLRHVICGAGPLTVELASSFEDRFGIPIIHGYGLSETTCYSCFLPRDLSAESHRQWLRAFGFPSIGTPIPANEMTIHDTNGVEVEEGVRGEIVIRGHNVMKEYFANPEANEKAFTYGWFRSGDEGFYRTDGAGRKFFFITGRIKELIIRGGMNISPFEIDEVLMAIPGVHTGLAVGFDNDWYGEEVGAYVRLADGASLSEASIIASCRKALPFQKSPKVVVFGNDIPVTSTGKYQRGKLKPLFLQWKAVQFTERGDRKA